MTTFGYEGLDDVFVFADVTNCALTEADEVALSVRVRRTGEDYLVVGADLPDAVDKVLNMIEPDERLVSDICRDYNLTPKDLRELVTPVEVPPAEPIVSEQQLVATAQPFVFDDADGQLYIALVAPIERL